MRYYAIEISEKRNSFSEERVIKRVYASHRNGVYDPGALQIEMDITRYDFATPTQEARVTIWGLPQAQMQQDTTNLFGKEIAVYGGMLNGLPLSRSGKPGLIIMGQILQVMGNWQGAELRLDLIVTCGPYRPDSIATSTQADLNFTLEWKAGQQLSEALENCFRANGNFRWEIDISDRLVNAYDNSMYCGNLDQLGVALKEVSIGLIKDKNYLGIQVSFEQGIIKVKDSPISRQTGKLTNLVELKFNELIGQPVWIQPLVVSVIVVMRHDLQVGATMRLPGDAKPVSLQESKPSFRDKSAFQGDFWIKQVRFLGNSRSPDANSWVTVASGVVIPTQGGDANQ